MDDTSNRRARETKILSIFLRKSAQEPKPARSEEAKPNGAEQNLTEQNRNGQSRTGQNRAEFSSSRRAAETIPDVFGLDSFSPNLDPPDEPQPKRQAPVSPAPYRSALNRSELGQPAIDRSAPDRSSLAEEYPHLSPEAAQLVRKMTNPADRIPMRSLRPHEETEEWEEASVPEQPLENREPQASREPQTFREPQAPREPQTFRESQVPRESQALREPQASLEISRIPEPSVSPERPEIPKKSPQTPASARIEPLSPWKPLSEQDYFRNIPAPRPVSDADTGGDAKNDVKKGEIVVVSNLHKGYVKGKLRIPVLRGVVISVHQGEYLSIVGQSGSGKSTLLHLIGTLDIPDSGMVHFDGQRIDNLPNRQRDLLRNRYIGMIFQFYHLIPEMTMIENVLAPLMIRENVFRYLSHRKQYHTRAKELLELVGLGHRIRHKPNELSGGEMQRTAIARALITEPRILLADEPTGNLDSRTSKEIVKLLRSLNREQKLTIIMVTHDTAQAEDADRYIRLVDGQIAETVQKR